LVAVARLHPAHQAVAEQRGPREDGDFLGARRLDGDVYVVLIPHSRRLLTAVSAAKEKAGSVGAARHAAAGEHRAASPPTTTLPYTRNLRPQRGATEGPFRQWHHRTSPGVQTGQPRSFLTSFSSSATVQRSFLSITSAI